MFKQPLSEVAVQEKKSSLTKKILILNAMVQEPFVALYAMMAIFLTKQLGASPFEIALLTMLKPIVSLFSFYWGSFLLTRKHHLKTNLLLASSLAVTPFLLSPFMSHVWFFIAAGAMYALFSKATIPALMELLRINCGNEKEKSFSRASIFAYIVGVSSALFFGVLLDYRPEWWTILFFLAALLALFATYVLSKMPYEEEEYVPQKIDIKESLVHPWKATVALLRERKDFLHFQTGFFLAGFGLMFAMPAIPGFLTKIGLSYTELFLSLSVLKGLGFIATSSLWARYLTKENIVAFSTTVFVGFSLFLVSLLLAYFDRNWVFAAYLFYGIAQAGSHLVWHLSGSVFSGKEASFQYSSVNVLAVGVRGCIAPLLGGIIAQFLAYELSLVLGALISFCGAYYMFFNRGSHHARGF